MTWTEYYKNYKNCFDITKCHCLNKVDKLGSAIEVYDVATEFIDEALCSLFVERAISENINFSSEQIIELTNCVEQETAEKLAFSNKDNLKEEDIEELSNIGEKVRKNLIDYIENKTENIPLSWAKFYERQSEWDDRKKIKELNRVKRLGVRKEVYDVATEFSDEAHCSLFVERVISQNITFTIDQIIELTCCVEQQTAEKLAYFHRDKLKKEDIEELFNISEEAKYKMKYYIENKSFDGYKDGWKDEEYWNNYYRKNPIECQKDIEKLKNVVYNTLYK